MSFAMAQNREILGCQWYGVKQIKSIFGTRGIVEKGLGYLLVSSSSSDFFNKTDFMHKVFIYISL